MINRTNVKQTIERSEITSVTCDICKKEFPYNDEDSMNIFELQEFVHIHETGGYGSVFGDGDEIELDMCQHCFKEKLGEYIRIK